jgi:hypothetical protein
MGENKTLLFAADCLEKVDRFPRVKTDFYGKRLEILSQC